MSTTTSNGVVQPSLKAYPEGANSARTAGIAMSNENTNKQTSLLGTAGGMRRKTSRRTSRKTSRKTYRKTYGGADSGIAVPTMQVLYPETGSGDQSVNGNITGSTALAAKTTTDQGYDACIGQGASCTAAVTQTAGRGRKSKKSRKSKKGGVKWGCYSGGKQKQKRKRKSKKRRNKNTYRRR